VFMPSTTVMKQLKGQYWLDDIMMSAAFAAKAPVSNVKNSTSRTSCISVTGLLRQSRMLPGCGELC
jgi:hypothetical protein